MNEIDRLLAEAEQQAARFSGWDFGWLEGRRATEPPPWVYGDLVRARLPSARALLEVDTGGGERLASFAPLPLLTAATEAWAPNVPVAAARLGPLGVHVVHAPPEDALPFIDGAFDLAIDHHGALPAADLFRVLRPGGWLVTQQVGGRNDADLVALVGGRLAFPDFDLARARAELEAAGFEIARAEEAFPRATFADAGALLYYLLIVPWAAPGFARERLRELRYPLTVRAHRFVVEARRP